MSDPAFYPELKIYLENIESGFTWIPDERIAILKQISEYINRSLEKSETADLVFICTHNSRRSQFGQVWASVAAEYYGIQGIRSFSGGTESTAFYSGAVAALERAGFRVEKPSHPHENPEYIIRTRTDSPKNSLFSKKYDHPANPSENFCAIMVCSDADEACPFIQGAAERISLPYNDPKAFDGTGEEKLKYDERCRDIAREIFYVLSLIG